MESGGGAPAATRNCPHCGAELGAYASFCWECQQSVSTAAGEGTAAHPAPPPTAPVRAAPQSAPYPPAPPPPAPYSPTRVVDPGPAPATTRRRRALRLGPTVTALAVIAVAVAIGLWISSGGGGSDGGGGTADPRPGAEHLGQWLTQVATFDGNLSESRVAQGVDSFGAQGLDVDVVRSDDFASLTPGSWIFYESASPTAEEAVARCVEIGRTDRSQCLARLLSDDEADRGEVRFVE